MTPTDEPGELAREVDDVRWVTLDGARALLATDGTSRCSRRSYQVA